LYCVVSHYSPPKSASVGSINEPIQFQTVSLIQTAEALEQDLNFND
jgi:hypothetical protein